MQRLTIYLNDELAAAVRQDADAKGQSLSTWISRAATLALPDTVAEEARAAADRLRRQRTMTQLP